MKKHLCLSAVLLLFVPVNPVRAQPQTQPLSVGQSSSATGSAPTPGQTQPPATSKQQSEPSSANKPTSATPSAPAQGQTQAPPAEKQADRAGGSSKSKANPPSVDAGYVIGDEDVLVIDVWQEKEFSVKAQVRPDGKITLPLLNDIQAAGLTTTELKASIETMLTKYVTDPRVTVIVEEINSRIIYLSGEVNKPGVMPLLRKMTVLQALTEAGGPNQFGNPRKIYVMRVVNGKQVKYPFDYRKAIKTGDLTGNIVLQPGDTIVVP